METTSSPNQVTIQLTGYLAIGHIFTIIIPDVSDKRIPTALVFYRYQLYENEI